MWPRQAYILAVTREGRLIVAGGTNKRLLGGKKRLLVLSTWDGKVINTQHIDNYGVAYDPYLINKEGKVRHFGTSIFVLRIISLLSEAFRS